MKEVINEFKKDAVMEFVNLHVGALESGFTSGNKLTVAELYRTAQNHIKDAYGIDTPSLEDVWGEEIAKECR